MTIISDVKADINMREVTFSFTAEELDAACERIYRRQKKDIAVKGFRKGKAPRKIVEKFYGEDVFYEDAINSLLGTEIDNIVKDLGLTLVDRPNIELVSVSKEEGATLKAAFVTKPEVTVSEYKGLHAPMHLREVSEADIDQQVDLLRQRQARMVTVDDRAAEQGDEVKINFEGFIDDEAFEGGKGEDYALRLGSGQFIPGFEDQIVGKSIGDKFDVNVTFPEEYADERFAGKPAVFKTELLAISKQELPEADDEFAKDVSEFDTLAELRDDIRKRLEEGAKRSADSAFENALFDQIVENTEAVIPQVMFDRRIDQRVDDFARQLQQQYGDQISLEEYLQLTGMTMESLRDEYEPQARKDVTLRLALEKIGETEGIVISDEEFDDELSKFASQIGAPLEFVRDRIPAEDFRADLIVTKAIELIKNNAVADTEEPAAEEAAAAEEAPEAVDVETTEPAEEA